MQKTAEQHVLARKKLSQSFQQELNGSFSTICDKHVTFPSRQSDNACMQITPRTISPSKGEAAMLDSHRKSSLGQLCSGRKEFHSPRKICTISNLVQTSRRPLGRPLQQSLFMCIPCQKKHTPTQCQLYQQHGSADRNETKWGEVLETFREKNDRMFFL